MSTKEKNMKKVLVQVICMLCLLSSCTGKNNSKVDIKSLGFARELAVVEYRFNNVAIISQSKGEGLTHLLEKDRAMFIEYEGTIKLGIDTTELIQDGGVIKIPKAKVLAVLDDPDTYQYVASKDSFFNKNKIEDKTIKDAIRQANDEQKAYMVGNEDEMNKAQELAEMYIREFVDSVDKDNGFKYKKQ